MEWFIGIVSGVVSAALWSLFAWLFVRAQREAQTEITRTARAARSWTQQISPDHALVELTYMGRGSARDVRIGLGSTNPPDQVVAAKVKHGKSLEQRIGAGTTYMRVDHLAHPSVSGRHRIIKSLWLDRLEFRQDCNL